MQSIPAKRKCPCQCRYPSSVCEQNRIDAEFNAKVKELKKYCRPLEQFLEQVKGGNLSMFGMMNTNNDTNSLKQNYERLKWLHSILKEKNTHSNNLEFLNESTSFLETISRLYNPHQSDINVNHEIINALEIEIDDLSNETQNLQKQIQRFTACQRCNSNFEKAGHERRVLRSGQVVCADCATRPPLYSDPFNTNPKKRSNPSPFLYQSQNTKKPKLISDQFWSSEPLYI